MADNIDRTTTELTDEIAKSYSKISALTQKYLATIKDINEKCNLTIQIGTHEDSAVDLAVMINKTIATQLGGGA